MLIDANPGKVLWFIFVKTFFFESLFIFLSYEV